MNVADDERSRACLVSEVRECVRCVAAVFAPAVVVAVLDVLAAHVPDARGEAGGGGSCKYTIHKQ